MDNSADTLTYSFPALLGALAFSAIVWGNTLAQAFSYFAGRWKDAYLLKLFLLLCLLLTTLQLATLCYYVNFVLITCRLPEKRSLAPTVSKVMIANYIHYFLTFLVQSLYAIRLWFVSHHKLVVVGPVLLLSTTQLISGIICNVPIAMADNALEVYNKFSHIFQTTSSVTALFCDIFIALSMVYFLQGRKSAFRNMKTVLHRITIYSVNTGIVTSLFAFLALVLWLSTPPLSFLWTLFYYPSGQVYVNLVFTMLLARRRLRELQAEPLNLSSFVGALRSFHIDGYPTTAVFEDEDEEAEEQYLDTGASKELENPVIRPWDSASSNHNGASCRFHHAYYLF